MSIQNEITRLSGNVSAALTAISNKGVTVPTGSNSDDLATLIAQIETGGGGPSYQLENIVPLQSITTDTAVSRGYAGAITQYTKTITPNEMYLITFDGTQYVCMGFIGDSSSYNAGDYRIYTSSTVLRYMITPFCVVYANGQNVFYLTTRDTNTHTLQIDKLTLL